MPSSHDSPLRPFWWTKRLTAVFIVAAALLLAMRIAWGYRMAARLDARKAWLRERGIVIDQKLIEQPVVPAERNQIDGLVRASRWIDVAFVPDFKRSRNVSWSPLAAWPNGPIPSAIARATLAEAMTRPERSWNIDLNSGLTDDDVLSQCIGLAERLALDAGEPSSSDAVGRLIQASWILDRLDEHQATRGEDDLDEGFLTEAIEARAAKGINAEEAALWRHLLNSILHRVTTDESRRRRALLRLAWASEVPNRSVYDGRLEDVLAPLRDAWRESRLIQAYHLSLQVPPDAVDEAWCRRLNEINVPSNSSLSQVVQRAAQDQKSRDDARRRAAMLIAAMLYRSDHSGRSPATLDELVPDYLPAIPMLSNGKPPELPLASTQPTSASTKSER